MPGSSALDALPLWAVFVIAVVIMLASADSGYRLGGFRRARSEDEKEGPVGAMVGSTLGLLAFLLAFTFNMAATRLDTRRSLLQQEANAIGTTYLRAATLTERGAEIRALLREYTDLRIEVARTLDIEEAARRSEAIQSRLWADATRMAQVQPESIVVGLFIQTLNEVIDIQAMRLTALRARVPPGIWITLAALVVIAFAGMGYHAGLSKTRRSPAAVAFIIGFAVVIVVTVDLDRPFEGWLRTSQQPMIDARRSMQEP
jgi:hypothetical protein